jgi:hypothetical protein
MQSKRFIHLVCMVFMCISLSTINSAFGQPGDPGGDPDVPITGIEVLLAIGGLFGVSRFLKNRKKA